MAASLNRNFKVKGNLKSYFQLDPAKVGQELMIEGIEVQLWHKAPLQKILLGTGVTDENADFTIEFSAESPAYYINEGTIKDVFIEASYNGAALQVKTELELLEGLVAYWNLDESTGSTATDLTGNGHAGSLEGAAPPVWVPGKINNGLQFNATPDGTVTSYVKVPASTDFVFGTGDFSIAFWLKHQNTSTYFYPLDMGYPSLGCLLLEYNSAVPGVYAYENSATIFGFPVELSEGAWYHLVFRRRNDLFGLYVNGVLLGEVTFTNSLTVGTELNFGTWLDLNRSLNGLMDELAIWKGHGLNDAEALALYNEGNGLAYPFNY